MSSGVIEAVPVVAVTPRPRPSARSLRPVAMTFHTCMAWRCQGRSTSPTSMPTSVNRWAAARTGLVHPWVGEIREPEALGDDPDAEPGDVAAQRPHVVAGDEPGRLAGVVAIGAGHHLQHQGGIGDVAGDRTQVVDGELDRERTRVGHQPRGWACGRPCRRTSWGCAPSHPGRHRSPPRPRRRRPVRRCRWSCRRRCGSGSQGLPTGPGHRRVAGAGVAQVLADGLADHGGAGLEQPGHDRGVPGPVRSLRGCGSRSSSGTPATAVLSFTATRYPTSGPSADPRISVRTYQAPQRVVRRLRAGPGTVRRLWSDRGVQLLHRGVGTEEDLDGPGVGGQIVVTVVHPRSRRPGPQPRPCSADAQPSWTSPARLFGSFPEAGTPCRTPGEG